jgi:hypothetical protein
MSTIRHRAVPLTLTMAVALVAALAALASGGNVARAHDGSHAVTTPISPKELALRLEMRRLWEDHVAWTRLAIVSLTSDSPDTQATVGRLLRNQNDIGDAIRPFYGAAAGKQLTALLREHILIAADVIAAAQKGDKSALTAQQARWGANADEIAAFLARANPKSWKPAAMKSMMRAHLALTTSEVVARLGGNWAADVRGYDRTHRQILEMADMLSNGLVAQFPARFR